MRWTLEIWESGDWHFLRESPSADYLKAWLRRNKHEFQLGSRVRILDPGGQPWLEGVLLEKIRWWRA